MIDSFRGPFFFLSNMFPCRVVLDGVVYPSAENAYQAEKTTDLALRDPFLTVTPHAAKRLGRRLPLRADWPDARLLSMSRVVVAKFADPALAAALISTGSEQLVEGNTWGDRFWGVCRGAGHNHLGKILMRTRTICALDRSADQP